MTESFPYSQEPTPPNPEHTQDSLHIYLPGMMGTDKGMKPIYADVQTTIAELYPGAQFVGKNSLISPDLLTHPEKDRFILLARQVVQAIGEGRHVYLYGHSFGAVEMTHILELVKKLRPDIWRAGTDINKVHITLMSPAGFGKDMLQTLTMLRRLQGILLASSEDSGHIYGLETIHFLPLRAFGSNPDTLHFLTPETQATVMTKLFFAESQLGEHGEYPHATTLDQIYAQPDLIVLERRFRLLSPVQKRELQEIDDLLSSYAETESGRKDQVILCLQRRGKLLSTYVQQTYDGKLEGPQPTRHTHSATDGVEKEGQDRTSLFVYIQAALGAVQLLKSYFTGHPYHELKAWYIKGVDTSFLIPEYDVLIKAREIAEFLGPDEKVEARSVILRTTTHSSSSIEPSTISASIRKFAERLARVDQSN